MLIWLEKVVRRVVGSARHQQIWRWSRLLTIASLPVKMTHTTRWQDYFTTYVIKLPERNCVYLVTNIKTRNYTHETAKLRIGLQGGGGRKQEVQLSQRDRAMLCVTEYFAKSLKIILFNCIFQFYWTNKWWWWWWWWWNEILEKDVSPHNYLVVTMYLVPFLRHSALNNGDTSKSGFGLFYRIPISNLIYQG